MRPTRSLLLAALLAITLPALPVHPALASPHSQPGVGLSAAPETPHGFLSKTIKYQGESYRYVVYVPADYDASKTYPTILFLNGAGECGRDGWKQVAVGLGPALMLNSSEWPFLVLIPQKPTVESKWEDHDALVMAMLEATKRDYKVDSDRLYLTGLSQGGHGTWTLGAKHADLFAAIAPVCGWADASLAESLKAMPIWAFHGEADMSVPVAAGNAMVQAVKDAGGDATITLYPGVGHNSWDNAYRNEHLGDWFLKHTRKAKTASTK